MNALPQQIENKNDKIYINTKRWNVKTNQLNKTATNRREKGATTRRKNCSNINVFTLTNQNQTAVIFAS